MKKRVLRLLAALNNYGLLNGSALFAKTEFRLSDKIQPPGVAHPIWLRPGTSDFPTFKQVFLDREYKINFNNPRVIFDCGANIGLFAVYMKTLFPEARIVCIEPDPENFAQVKKNLAGYEGVYFENSGLWNRDTMLKVYDKYNSGKWAMVVEEDPENGTIPAVSVQSLMKKYGVERIDVLKMDIETSEKQVFSSHYEEWLPKVKNIVIEFHDFLLDGCSKTFFEAINRCIGNYEFLSKGENVIIRNKDLP